MVERDQVESGGQCQGLYQIHAQDPVLRINYISIDVSVKTTHLKGRHRPLETVAPQLTAVSPYLSPAYHDGLGVLGNSQRKLRLAAHMFQRILSSKCCQVQPC